MNAPKLPKTIEDFKSLAASDASDAEVSTDPDSPQAIAERRHQTIEEWWAQAHPAAQAASYAQRLLAEDTRDVAAAFANAAPDPCALCTLLIGTLKALLPRLPLPPTVREIAGSALDITGREIDRHLREREREQSK